MSDAEIEALAAAPGGKVLVALLARAGLVRVTDCLMQRRLFAAPLPRDVAQLLDEMGRAAPALRDALLAGSDPLPQPDMTADRRGPLRLARDGDPE